MKKKKQANSFQFKRQFKGYGDLCRILSLLKELQKAPLINKEKEEILQCEKLIQKIRWDYQISTQILKQEKEDKK